MRIGIDGRYIQDHFPGIGRYTYSLVSGLAPLADEHTIVLLTNPALPNTRYDLSALAAHHSVEQVRVDVSTFSASEQFRLPGLLSQLSLSLLHCPYYVRPYRVSLPTVLTIYDTIPSRYPNYYTKRSRILIRWLKRLALRTSDHCLAISEATKSDFEREYRVDPQQITAVPLATSDLFRPIDSSVIATVRERYGLPAEYVLYLGINKPHKNLVRLVEAWALLLGTYEYESAGDTSLVLAGREDPRYPHARRRVQQLDLERSVRFLGDVSEDDLPALYSGAQVFVFPSLYEGFGLPVLEAMACGTPVCCSDSSSLPEIAGEAALKFDPTDSGSIAASLRCALGNDDLRRDLSAKGLERAARFTWSATARRTLNVYRLVAEGKS